MLLKRGEGIVKEQGNVEGSLALNTPRVVVIPADTPEQARKLRKQLEELRLVSRAKCILIETGGLTEPEAHAFLEKQAMNRRMTKVDVARELLQARE